jgi:hypothetical protein
VARGNIRSAHEQRKPFVCDRIKLLEFGDIECDQSFQRQLELLRDGSKDYGINSFQGDRIREAIDGFSIELVAPLS